MSKKPPKGVSVKTIPEEFGLVETYRYQIHKDGKVIDESIIKYNDRDEARNEGVKKYWKSKEGATLIELLIGFSMMLGLIAGIIIITLTVKGCNYVKDTGIKNIAETVWNGTGDT